MKASSRVVKIVLGLLATCTAVASFAMAPQRVQLKVESIFSIEHGFDTNDTLELALWGYLPNSCYQVEKGYAEVDEANKKIYVRMMGYKREDQLSCLQIVTPYQEIIKVGLLKAGRYEVTVANNANLTKSMTVAEARTEDGDNHLYAPVDTVALESISNNNKSAHNNQLKLEGTYPYMLTGCMRVTEVETYVSQENILVVQPKASVFEDQDCDPNDIDQYNRFEVVKDITAPKIEKLLIHVRTLNGQSLNKFIKRKAIN